MEKKYFVYIMTNKKIRSLYVLFVIIVLLTSCRKEVSRMYVRDVSLPIAAYLGDTVNIDFRGYFPSKCWELDRFDSKESYLELEVYLYMKKVDNYCPLDSIPFEYSAKFVPRDTGEWAIVTYGADTTIVKYLHVSTNF